MVKHLAISFACFALAAAPLALPAQTGQAAEAQAPALNAEQLDQLLAPIALYPDPLLAQILPASTVPGDVVMAARYVASKKDPEQIDAQPWEESVKALARYPDVLKMMDEKLDWTTALGQAFVAQPSDVFNSVQRLRAKAQEVGNLKDSPQQVVVVEKEVIKIMPADPQIIYVPQYQPQVVYVQQPVNVVAPIITFGAGLALGIWIHNELDWHNHNVYYHNGGWNNSYHGGNNYYRGGNNVNINGDVNIGKGNGNSGSVWKPQTKPKAPSLGNGNGNGNLAGANRPGNGNLGGSSGSKWPGQNNNHAGAGNGNGNSWSGNRNPPTPAKPLAKPAQLPAKLPAQNSATRPNQPLTRPGGQASQGDALHYNREGTKAFPASEVKRPAMPTRQAPVNRPAGAGGGFGGGGGSGKFGGGGAGGGKFQR